MLRTLGFHHITLVVSDGRRSTEFFRELLGLRVLVDGVDVDDASLYRAYLGDESGAPGRVISLLEMPDAPRGRYGVGGVHHLAFGVPTYEALLMWKRRLQDRGVAVTGPMPRGYFTSLYFRDPDGQVLEIATAGPGYTFDEPIDTLGRAVMQPGASQLVGTRDEATIAATTHDEPVPTITPGMALTGLHHVSAMTDDIDRAHDFYESALGLSLVKKTVNQDDPTTPHWVWANYDGQRVAVNSSWTLFGWTPRHPKAHAGIGQTQRVAFRAASVDELGAWRSHLAGTGVTVSPILDRQFFTAIEFNAPDGQPLALATDRPGFMTQ